MKIIGCGNPSCGDDAAGLLVAARLRALGINATPCTTAPDLAGEDDVILVDAMQSGAAPGSIRVWDGPEVPRAIGVRCSTHGFGVADAVAIARAIGRAPARLRVYGIEGATFGPGTEVSPAVDGAIEIVVASILRELAATRVQPVPNTDD
jgi:hydrogenase maturation protease